MIAKPRPELRPFGTTKPIPKAGHVTGDAAAASHRGMAASASATRRLHRKQAAVYLGLSLSWLDKARLKGDGPAYVQIGGRVVYDTADLDAFLAQHRRSSTAG
jgi:predicted DNA-binding transcriptional regulator AlpA